MTAPDLHALVAGLPQRATLDGFWDEMDALLADGGAARLADIGIAVRTTYGARPVPHVRAAVDGLLRRLALLPWPGHVPQVLRLASGAGITTRYVASLLAAGQDIAELGPALSRTAPAAMRACLAQELVLRGARDPAPMPSGHPLSVLPGVLTALEDDPPLPRYGLDWTGRPDTLAHTPDTDPDARTSTPPFVADAGPAGADAAVATWSGATVDARTVEIVEPLATTSVPHVVAALDLAAPGSGTPIVGAPCPANTAWRLLFAAACHGGAHGPGEYGAYGRLAAWRALGALCGAGEHAPVTAIAHRAADCTWFRFRADPSADPSYHDLGLAGLAPDGRRLVVLSAADPT